MIANPRFYTQSKLLINYKGRKEVNSDIQSPKYYFSCTFWKLLVDEIVNKNKNRRNEI